MADPRAIPHYRVYTEIQRPDRKLVAAFQQYATAPISDAMHKRQTLPYEIKSVHRTPKRMAGPALTVFTPTGDELLTLKAFEIAQPGDVIVIAGCAAVTSSVMGGVMAWMAKVRGIAGIVTDGLVRDYRQINDSGLPIHARGLTPLAPTHDVPPGDLNCPVCIGDAVISPGDMVVADDDGVVVVPAAILKQVAESVDEEERRDDKWIEDLKRTKSIADIMTWCAVDKAFEGDKRTATLGKLYDRRP